MRFLYGMGRKGCYASLENVVGKYNDFQVVGILLLLKDKCISPTPNSWKGKYPFQWPSIFCGNMYLGNNRSKFKLLKGIVWSCPRVKERCWGKKAFFSTSSALKAKPFGPTLVWIGHVVVQGAQIRTTTT